LDLSPPGVAAAGFVFRERFRRESNPRASRAKAWMVSGSLLIDRVSSERAWQYLLGRHQPKL
jgi:hypothetical protein